MEHRTGGSVRTHLFATGMSCICIPGISFSNHVFGQDRAFARAYARANDRSFDRALVYRTVVRYGNVSVRTVYTCSIDMVRRTHTS
jgi:hypothetical protein